MVGDLPDLVQLATAGGGNAMFNWKTNLDLKNQRTSGKQNNILILIRITFVMENENGHKTNLEIRFRPINDTNLHNNKKKTWRIQLELMVQPRIWVNKSSMNVVHVSNIKCVLIWFVDYALTATVSCIETPKMATAPHEKQKHDPNVYRKIYKTLK